MTARRIEFWTYLTGVVALGLAIYPLERATGGGLGFVALVLGYLILVRLFGRWLARRRAAN